MARITGLSYVAIKSDRFEETLRFYKDGLGLFLVQQTKDSAVLRVPDGTVIEVFAGGEPSRNTAGITHFCFNAHNLKAVMERAVCFGAAVKTQPYPLGELNIGFVIAPKRWNSGTLPLSAMSRPVTSRAVTSKRWCIRLLQWKTLLHPKLFMKRLESGRR